MNSIIRISGDRNSKYEEAQLLRNPGNTLNEAIELFAADKVTTIEGNMAEIYTEEKLIRPITELRLSSLKWWFWQRKFGSAYSIEALSELDPATLRHSHFEQNLLRRMHAFSGGALTYVNSNFRRFTRFNVDKDRFADCLYPGFGGKQLHPTPLLSKNFAHSDIRITKASTKLNEWNELQQVVSQRLYANFYANLRPLWDVDGVGIFRNKHLIIFDYKHKYPYKNGEGKFFLGANKGISDLYSYLASKGAKVVYVVWMKKDFNKNTPAVDYLADESPTWLVCDATMFFMSSRTVKNIDGSAQNGGTPVDSKAISLDHFTTIKNANQMQAFLDSVSAT